MKPRAGVRRVVSTAATHKTEGLLVQVIVLLSFDGNGLRTGGDVNGTLALLLFDSFSLTGFRGMIKTTRLEKNDKTTCRFLYNAIKKEEYLFFPGFGTLFVPVLVLFRSSLFFFVLFVVLLWSFPVGRLLSSIILIK